MASLLRGNFSERLHNAFFNDSEFNIGIVNEPISRFLEGDSELNINWLPRSEGSKFLADPFGIERDGRLHIVCEEFDRETSKGRIVSIEITPGKQPPKVRVAIELPTHMSYPFLLEYHGSIYCIPETRQAREVSLYRADDFPYSWTKVSTLLANIGALDSTVFKYNGYWWLACTQEQNRLTKLFIWYSSDIFGEWKPHPRNPVKNDIRSSRPGGTPFLYEGRLYRPAQDCSESYGKRITINRVLRLTPTEFKEETASVVEPEENWPYPHGMHTISTVGNMTLLDAKRVIHGGLSFRRIYRNLILKR